MEHQMNFRELVRKTSIGIFLRFVLAVLILYILPLITISGEGALGEKLFFFFFNLVSWFYMSLFFLIISAIQIRKMLLLIKKEMDIVYKNSIQIDTSENRGNLTLFEFSETDKRIRSMKEKIKEMIEKERAQKEDLIFKVSAASHDLKTPLTVIQGNSDLLSYSSLSSTERQCVEDITIAAERMKHYFNSLIDYSKTYYEEGVERDSYTLSEISEAIRQEIFFHSKEKDKVIFQTSTFGEETVSLHLNYLLRAVSNLLNNAKEATKGSTIPIEINFLKKNDKLILSVWNYGSSFSKQMLTHGSKLFYRENTARTSETSHFGIGLAFVKRVAELHQGSLTLSNEKGGALVQLTLNLF